MASSNSPTFSPLLLGAGSAPDVGGGPTQFVVAIWATSGPPQTQGGPTQQATAIQAASVPQAQGGPTQGATAIQAASVPQAQGGPTQQTVGILQAGPPQTQGGPTQQVLTLSPTGGGARVGNIQGRTAGEFTIPGGVGFMLDGAQYSERETFNLQSSPGVTWRPVDNPGANRVDLGLDLNAEIELARIVIDATLAPQDFLVVAPVAPQVAAWATRVVYRAVTITGLTSHPTLSVGTNAAAFDDQIPATALSFTVADQVRTERVASGSDVPLAAPGGGLINVRLSVSAVATAYAIEAVVMGRVIE